ncbi:hypothetical protein C2S52_013264 [Perilla frutescens var. hirtella]|nr:hypothetical protein C2S52_013264 [Perilla frutescens var. hirtella]
MFNKTFFKLFLSIITFVGFSSAVDTLFHNQSIAVFGERTLVSQNQVFELGFFCPGKSRNIFLGIWYKATPDIVVWVANRINPITTHSQGLGVFFAISENGSLAISSRGGSGSVIWSENPSRRASNPVVQLLDSGNLVVVEETKEGYLWQSFDYPTDTWLPGMKIVDDIDAGVKTNLTSWRNSDDPSPGDFVLKIENEGLPEVVVYRGKMKIFRTGKWNGVYLSGVPRFPNVNSQPELFFREEKLIYMSRPYDSSIITRATLDISGSAHRYTMNARKDKWSSVYAYPRDQCDEYGLCGPNGICTIENALRCSCFRGFSPKFQNDWDIHDWSGGCARITALNCQGGDVFLEIKGVKYPDMFRFWLNTRMSLDECKAECLKNCSCTAYANPYITNGGSGCLMWYGDLIDTRELFAADSMQNIYVRVPVSELDFSNNLEEKKWPLNLILISMASGVIVSICINGGILLLTRRKKQAVKRKEENIELPLVKMATVLEATNNFSRENMIGEGGFGPVYMGSQSTGEKIAVKRLSRTSGQGLEEFKNEVILIAKLQHRNLVRLLGCCIDGEERVLIYEYLPNKSLDCFVFDPDKRTVLTWPKRYDIIMGIARGLLYLHHDSRLKIIHRDLKTSNILLDANLNPKISDFGIARTFEEDQPIDRTRRVVGTYGYMAPEYANYGKFSVKSDIFSLGVVLIEIISGKKNRGFEDCHHYHSLLSQAWLLWKEKRSMEVMDECLNDSYMESQVRRCIHVGLLCVQNFLEDRPLMSSVVLMLASDGAILPEPKEPGFFIERSCSPLQSCTSPTINSENNTLTITDLEAR